MRYEERPIVHTALPSLSNQFGARDFKRIRHGHAHQTTTGLIGGHCRNFAGLLFCVLVFLTKGGHRSCKQQSECARTDGNTHTRTPKTGPPRDSGCHYCTQPRMARDWLLGEKFATFTRGNGAAWTSYLASFPDVAGDTEASETLASPLPSLIL